MSGLTFRLKGTLDERIDAAELTPRRLAKLSQSDIERIVVGSTKRQLKVGDVFVVGGRPGDSVTFESGSNRLDFVGSRLEEGSVIVEGDVGDYAGREMSGGRLDIRGDAGAYLASGTKGGIVTVKGSAGNQVGAQRAGDKFGMMGGIVVIEGHAGDRVGDRMRRGTIIVRGRCGAIAGTRMLGGTIWTDQGFGANPGLLMRRGTLIGPNVEKLLATFVDTGKHDLVILRVLSRYLAATLGPLAPRPITGPVRKYAGDLATIGKGELLIAA
ncbi:MAG: formylmethanofuran dehydrogenase subunit C [Hyphomicrobium sp.]